jgi:hypothetical protein
MSGMAHRPDSPAITLSGEVRETGEAVGEIPSEKVRSAAGNFLTTVRRHRIQNQLSIVLGFCDLLQRTLDAGDPRAGDLRTIETAARTALTLLHKADEPDAEERGVA